MKKVNAKLTQAQETIEAQKREVLQLQQERTSLKQEVKSLSRSLNERHEPIVKAEPFALDELQLSELERQNEEYQRRLKQEHDMNERLIAELGKRDEQIRTLQVCLE